MEHLTEAQKKAYILADNKLALDAGWDNEPLALVIQALEDLNFDVDRELEDIEIIQTVDDNKASWYCGDGKGKYGITNRNYIGVEICVNSDSDYDKAVERQ